jgi:hypothetical protein
MTHYRIINNIYIDYIDLFVPFDVTVERVRNGIDSVGLTLHGPLTVLDS